MLAQSGFAILAGAVELSWAQLCAQVWTEPNCVGRAQEDKMVQSDEETLNLIEVWADETIQVQLEGCKQTNCTDLSCLNVKWDVYE